jgi:aspartate racemase
MKTIGLIGGTSWHSSVVYYKLINQLVGAKIGTQANPQLILFSINIELMREQNSEKINAKYLEVATKLQVAGAQAIVICANTPHMVYDHVQPEIDIPILHIADATAHEASRLRLNKLGLLGNKPTISGDFIPSRLRSKFNIETIKPDAEVWDQSHYFISRELTQGIFSDNAKRFYIEQIDHLQKKGAQGVILGCTELPMLITQDDVAIPLLATTQLHAEMAVDFILG